MPSSSLNRPISPIYCAYFRLLILLSQARVPGGVAVFFSKEAMTGMVLRRSMNKAGYAAQKAALVYAAGCAKPTPLPYSMLRVGK